MGRNYREIDYNGFQLRVQERRIPIPKGCNDLSLKCPSDAESNHILPLGDDVVFTPGVVGEYQPEGDVDHRHLDAEFQP